MNAKMEKLIEMLSAYETSEIKEISEKAIEISQEVDKQIFKRLKKEKWAEVIKAIREYKELINRIVTFSIGENEINQKFELCYCYEEMCNELGNIVLMEIDDDDSEDDSGDDNYD